MASLLSLPDELIQNILLYIPLQSLIAVAATSSRLHQLSDYSLLWMHFCQEEYRFWNASHNVNTLFESRPGSVSFHDLLISRKHQDRVIVRNLESILATQKGRLHKIQAIVDHGYDAKDILRQHLNVPDDADDVLARRYYTNEILGCIERTIALEEWDRMRNDPDIPLERALGAFDLFIAERPSLTLDEIGARIDSLAADFTSERPAEAAAPPRPRALALVAYLRERGFIIASPERFRLLQNNLISVSLCDPSHGSLPLICVAVFCCVARRLGLDARPCSFPERVLAIITAADRTHSLDGLPHDFPPSNLERMYLDPSLSADEVSTTQLYAQLDRLHVPPSQRPLFLSPSDAANLVLRTAHNIVESLRSQPPYTTALARHPHLTTVISPHRASLAAHTVQLLLGVAPRPGDAFAHVAVHRALNNYVKDLMSHFRADVAAMETHILPLFEGQQMEHSFLQHMAREVRADDEIAPSRQARPDTPVPMRGSARGPAYGSKRAGRARASGGDADIDNGDDLDADAGEHADADAGNAVADPTADTPPVPGAWVAPDTTSPSPSTTANAAATVTYRVGTLFRHARYGYLAAISGWDPRCQASGEWIAQMGIDALNGGRAQAFYHALVEDESTRYVAEENVVPLNVPGGEAAGVPNAGLLRIAGRCFKRWDGEEGRFVSNVRDQYPDD